MILKDEWLSEIFGYGVYQVEDETGEVAIPRHEPPAFFYAKVPTSKVSQLRQYCRSGAYVVDTAITFARPPDKGMARLRVGGEVAAAEPEYYDAILSIADTFCWSRFHQDPLIPNEIANDIKRAWIGNYFAGRRGEKVIVAIEQDKPVGFLAVMPGSNGDDRVIDLIATHPDYRERGIGKRLVAAFIASYPWSTLRVGTQASNVQSLRLYEACGFRIESTAYVLHYHTTR